VSKNRGEYGSGIVRWVSVVAVAIMVTLVAAAKDKPDNAIDSGTFGVFVKGQRVINETFSIHREESTSIIKAELKEAPGAPSVEQESTLEIGPNAELIRYAWSQRGGGSIEVLPRNEFLIEKITPPNGSKPAEQPFLMPNTSFILDNNFFVQREVLAWRYLASDCQQVSGTLKCHKAPEEFGVVVPQDRISMRVKMQLIGPEKVNIAGTDRELLRLNLSGDSFNWAMWVDGHNHFKLMRIDIPSDNIQVLRD